MSSPDDFTWPPRYEPLRQLGRGAMGLVWLARDRETGGEVAIKMLAAGSPTPTQKARFAREAEVLARLRHPNVLHVHELLDTPKGQLLVADYVPGESLAERIERGPLDPRSAARLFSDLANGLAQVHAEGVVHRDVKPANILVDPEGRAVLVDFGIARPATGESLTKSGTILGTPQYMAPEQAVEAKRVDGRADLYSLGACLYEALTTQPPLQGATNLVEFLAMLTSHVPAAPRSLNAEIDPALDALCMRCLEKDPAERFQTAVELADALDRIYRPAEAQSGSHVLLGLGLLVLIGTGVALAAKGALEQDSLSPTSSSYAPTPEDSPSQTPLEDKRIGASLVDFNAKLDQAGKLGDTREAVEVYDSVVTRAIDLEALENLRRNRPEDSGLALDAPGGAVHPSVFNVLAARGSTLFGIGEFERASEDLRIARSIRPRNPISAGVYPLALARSGAPPDRVQRAFLAATRVDPKQIRVWSEFLGHLITERSYRRAEEAAREALEHFPTPEIRILHSRALHAMGLLGTSLAVVQKSLEVEPGNPYALEQRGRLLLQLGQPEAASRDFGAVVQASPGGQALEAAAKRGLLEARRFPPARRGISATAKRLHAQGVQATRARKLKEAVRLYREAIRLSPGFGAAYRELGGAYVNLGAFPKGESALSVALFLDPTDDPAYAARALTRARLGRFEEAAADLRLALRHGNTGKAPLYRTHLGSVLLNMKKFEEAIEVQTKVLERNPVNRGALMARSICYRQLDRLKDALTDSGNAISMGWDAELGLQHGLNLFALERYDEAITQFARGIASDPSRTAEYLHRGRCLLKLGDPKRALRDMNRAVESNPSSGLFRAHRAKVLRALGQKVLARQEAIAALELSPDALESVEILYALNDLPQGPQDPAPLTGPWEKPIEDPAALAFLLCTVGAEEEAKPFLARARKLSSSDTLVLASEGLLALEANQTTRAQQALEAAFAKAPDSCDLGLAYAQALQTGAERGQGRESRRKALAVLEALIREHAGWLEPRVRRAVALLGLNRFRNAEAYAEELLNALPYDRDLLLTRARAAGQRSDYDAAKKDLDLARRAWPNVARVHFERARVALKEDQYAEARVMLRSSLRADPNFAEAWGAQAFVTFQIGEFESAELHASRALSIRVSASDLALRAAVRLKLDKREKARKDAQRALIEDPDNALAREVLRSTE